MQEIRYGFVDLDTDTSFEQLKNAFGGTLESNTIHFDNSIVQGNLVRRMPETGLWIRKWKLTAFQKVLLHRDAAPADDEVKLNLIYFLDPALFNIKNQSKKVPLTHRGNNLLFSNEAAMDFSVLPKQPFYVVDISFTAEWLSAQFTDAEYSFKLLLTEYTRKGAKVFLKAPCLPQEYKTLHELDTLLQAGTDNGLAIRASVYALISSFFDKVVNRQACEAGKQVAHYAQVVAAKGLLMTCMKKPPSATSIAQSVSMSQSSLSRQFQLLYGKSMHDYYMEHKMELAKKMITEDRLTIKQVAYELGYKQSSPFIEIFRKQHGFSPGSLKL